MGSCTRVAILTHLLAIFVAAKTSTKHSLLPEIQDNPNESNMFNTDPGEDSSSDPPNEATMEPKTTTITTTTTKVFPRAYCRNGKAWRCKCNPSSPCTSGEGNCRKDEECAANLICGVKNCRCFHESAPSRRNCCKHPTSAQDINGQTYFFKDVKF